MPRTARNKFKSVFRRDMCALQRGFSCPLRGNSPSGRKLFARSENRRSAASGGNSKSVSRKRHDWRACKGAGIVMPRRCNVADALWAARHEAQRRLFKKAALAAFLKTKKDAFGRLFALCSSNPLEKTAEKWYIVLVKMCHYTLIVGDDAFFQGGYRSCT